MAVQGRLWIARGAARIAHARRRIFVKRRPLVLAALRANPGFIADQSGDAAVAWQLVGVAHCHIVLDRRTASVHGLHDGQEAHVEAEHRIFCVIDDPADLIRMQTRIERVQHAARAADTKVELQMAVTIPGQGRHPVTELQFHGVERVGNLTRAHCHFLVGVTVDVAFNPARNDFTFAVMAFGKFDKRRDQQLLVLHQPEHEGTPDKCLNHANVTANSPG